MYKRIQHFQGNDRYGFQHNLTFKRLTKLILLATKQPGVCYNTPEVRSHIQDPESISNQDCAAAQNRMTVHSWPACFTTAGV